MRVTTKIVWDIDGHVLEHEWHDYSGPLELADRAATNEATSAYQNANSVAGGEQVNANAANAQLTPFYRQEMNATHAFNPEQTNELLNYAGATGAGGMATTGGEANSQAARTRNTSGFSSALDEASRQRNQQIGKENLGVGMADVTGAKELNQEGAHGMQGLYGTDTSAMLSAMGQEAPDINAQVNAGKSGWFQNLLGAGDMAANLIKAIKSGGGGNGGGGGGN